MLLSVSLGSFMIQRCGFILSSGNCQLLGKGSRLQTISNHVKGVVEVNLRTGVRGPGMIRFCCNQWLRQVRELLWVSVSPGENDGSWIRCSLRILLGEGNGTPLQFSCLENPMDRGAWKAAVHGVAEGQTRLSDFTFTFHFHALEKEMATHSCSCLENPRDGGAWWAATYGVAWSQTWLKWLSSSKDPSGSKTLIFKCEETSNRLITSRILNPAFK